MDTIITNRQGQREEESETEKEGLEIKSMGGNLKSKTVKRVSWREKIIKSS